MAARNGVGTRQRVNAGETRKADALGKSPSSSRTPPPNQYAISDGRIACGIVREVADGFTAIDTGGSIIGTFSTLLAARPTETQLATIAAMEAAGAYCCIVEGLDRALSVLEHWGLLRGRSQ